MGKFTTRFTKEVRCLTLILIIILQNYIIPASGKTSTHLTLEIHPSATAHVGDTVEFWARCFDASGNVLFPTIKFYVSGGYIGADSNPTTGWVEISYVVNLSPGSYEVKASFDCDSTYS